MNRTQKYSFSMRNKYKEDLTSLFGSSSSHTQTTAEVVQCPQPQLFIPDTKKEKVLPNLNSYEIFETKIRPNLTAKENFVYQGVVQLGRCTMHQCADFLHVSLHTISGRFGKLVEKNYLKIVKQEENTKRAIYEAVIK